MLQTKRLLMRQAELRLEHFSDSDFALWFAAVSGEV
jgi:hypothetical protein